MDTLIVAGILVVIALIGLLDIYRRRRQTKSRNAFAGKYLENFQKLFMTLANHTTMSQDKYKWLTRNGPRMQAYLGPLGYMSYKPYASSHIFKNFQIIVDTMSQIGAQQDDPELLQWTEDALLRYTGILEHQLSGFTSALKNPLLWLRDGVAVIVQSPIHFLGAIGLLNTKTTTKIAHSAFVRFLSGFIMLLGLLAAVITIVNGWSKFSSLINQLISKL